MPQSAKEEVNITALIKGVLNGYPGNSAIFREYLQNSDDAKAKLQTFILDERQHATNSLIDASLKGSQGAALIAINDGDLSERDWKALTTIHSSSKQKDETQTGKNGLGFRASYHLTENPHVFSGGKLMVLDPHGRFTDFPGGVSLNVVDEGSKYHDQLAAFSSLSSLIDDPFKRCGGTVFRLPLRTAEQAKLSKIKETPTSVDEIRTLLLNFGRVEIESAILFLKHIRTIEIRHIDLSGKNTLVGQVTISERPSDVAKGTFTRRTTLLKGDGDTKDRDWMFIHVDHDKEVVNRLMTDRLGYDVGDSLIADKLTPMVELAVPLNDASIRGSLYTLLPLPIKTGFAIHINAVFALTPDRQSLKNIEETGAPESRERRLVEWNRVIFDEWVPAAWKVLLEELSSQREPWSIWPSASGDGYWANLLFNLTKVVLESQLKVFPTVLHEGQSQFVNLTDHRVILSPRSPPISLDVIVKLGIHVIQPPAHIYETLRDKRLSAEKLSTLSPENLHRNLVQGKCGTPEFSAVAHLVDYLVFSESSSLDLQNLVGLEWFHTTTGEVVCFSLPSQFTDSIVIAASDAEAQLFASYQRMLAPDSMPKKLHSVLIRPKSAAQLNVKPLGEVDVYRMLSSTSHQPAVSWAINFWTWLSSWSKHQSFFQSYGTSLSSLKLLPISDGSLREISSKALYIEDSDTSKAWQRLGLPIINHQVVSRVSVLAMLIERGYVVTEQQPEFVPFLLETYNVDLQNMADSIIIGTSLYRACYGRHWLSVSDHQRAKLERLSIFSVRDVNGGESALASVVGTRVYLTRAVDDDFPLPVQGVVYVDLRSPTTEVFCRLLDPNLRTSSVSDLLRVAMDKWTAQPEDLQDKLIEYIFNHPLQLSNEVRLKLKTLPFVSVNGTTTKMPPVNLIHPSSDITHLFQGEIGRIPVGRFSEGSYVTHLVNLGFLPSALSRSIVEERLMYLSGDVSHDEHAFNKATVLLNLLDYFWDEGFRKIIVKFRDYPWLPLVTPCTLVSPSKSRDSQLLPDQNTNPVYYDLVLHILTSVALTRRQLRSALGWSDRVPLEVLTMQLNRTILQPSGVDRARRLTQLISYFSSLYGRFLTENDVAALRSIVGTSPWIPTQFNTDSETISIQYALLTQVNVEYPFRYIAQEKWRDFLRAMGCRDRPDLSTLKRELSNFTVPLKSSETRKLVALLDELASYHTGERWDGILIPGVDRNCHSFDTIYYPDTKEEFFIPKALSTKVATHPLISSDLSDRLKITTLSSLLLDLGADDDDEQMGEDFVLRVQNFLKEYDISHAFNEVIANADDAGATELAVSLDCRRRSLPSSGIVSPEFAPILCMPSLVFCNNSILSEDDFKGLLRIGKGGKAGQSDTHGRHGLGALSFYYFTDVVTVISGSCVMILDPSGRYLPATRGRKRTSIRRKLEDFCSQYPNQLHAFEGAFGFKQGSSHFPGTLFCLPLVTSAIAPLPCTESDAHRLLTSKYKTLAENAFFFTNMCRIRCIKVHSNGSYGKSELLWSLSATRTPSTRLGPRSDSDYLILDLTTRIGRVEKWMICSSRAFPIPNEHSSVAETLKLTDRNLKVRIAIDFTSGHKGRSWFFSTLRIPKASSFPFHVHARFALSSNRQSIVFDSTDSRGKRESKSSFNLWLLTNAIPSLYLETLEFVLRPRPQGETPHVLADDTWWLLRSSDEISQHTGRAFQKLLVESDARLLVTTTGNVVPFKEAVFAPPESPLHDGLVRFLTLLKTPRLITEYSGTGLKSLEASRTIDATYVVDNLRRAGSLEMIRRFYEQQDITLQDLITVLFTVAQEGQVSSVTLVALPLLVLSTDVPVAIPGSGDPLLYLSANPVHSSLFRNSRFIRHEYAHESFKSIWSSNGINVAEMSNRHIPALVSHELQQMVDSRSRDRWLKDFWKMYYTLPGPLDVSDFDSEDIAVIRSCTEKAYTFSKCQPDDVVFVADLTERQRLLPVLAELQIDIIKTTGITAIDTSLSKRFPSPVLNVLKCLKKLNITDFGRLAAENASFLIEWLHKNMTCSQWSRYDPGVDRRHLSQLKIWKCMINGRMVWSNASILKILPASLSLKLISPFAPPDVAFAVDTFELRSFMAFCNWMARSQDSKPAMSLSQVMSCMDIPSSLQTASEFRAYSSLIGVVLGMGEAYSELRIFDTDGLSRRVVDLFDHHVDLFSVALSRTQTPSFIHPLLRSLDIGALRRFGLKHEISLATVTTCANAVQDVYLNDQSLLTTSVDEIHRMARTTFEAYRDLPSHHAFASLHRNSWTSLDSILFVQPKPARRQGASYPAERFFTDGTPILVRPLDCVLPELEPIAWTQRHLFMYSPGDAIKAVNKNLGVPSVAEVVKHLEFLTTRIAPRHPGNSTLLSDIKATYKWLDERSESATEHLTFLSDKRLFLNVDDPSSPTEWWGDRWVTASQLLLNVDYDHGGVDLGRLQRVKRFLQDYSKLLRAAGSDSLTKVSFSAVLSSQTSSISSRYGSLPMTFNEMRAKGEMTDVVFVAEEDWPSTSVGDSEIDFSELDELRAHRAFLAAAVPHFRQGGEGWNDSRGRYIKFFGTSFGAKAFLEFVYTGRFDICPPRDTSGWANLLNELLKLLEYADCYEMPDLLAHIEHCIIHEYDLIHRLLTENLKILEYAQLYKARNLEMAIDQLYQRNPQLIEKFNMPEPEFSETAQAGNDGTSS